MSEEILKALMELSALIVKQDGGMIANERDFIKTFLTKRLTKESVDKYLAFFDDLAGPVQEDISTGELLTPTVKDSVKIFSICKKINRTLTLEQKVIALVSLYELLKTNKRFTPQRMNIINTVAEVFKILPEEFSSIEQFVRNDDPKNLTNPSILVLNSENVINDPDNKSFQADCGTCVCFLRIPSVNLYFLKYISNEQFFLNGLPVISGQVYPFAKGASIRSGQGNVIYYSDISSRYMSDLIIHKLSFVAENLSYNFREEHRAINNINFSIGEGKLMGILGGSGSGKTTLLNLLSGIYKPAGGSVRINGFDINSNSKELEGVIGFVAQDDLLIEDLTVFENLYFASCQCFNNKSSEEITSIVEDTLLNLGLLDKKDFKVGDPFNKILSGGQRKRLNIALELIREPSVLFLDEPTSGLSSKDSETIMDLLRDLTLKGKLVITVIHQPSSEIFKMFDKILILDQEGYMVYYGNPVDAVIYFKTLDAQINAGQGECPVCGNVNTEIIFNILETHVVDEFGNYTERRKVKPKEWADIYGKTHPPEKISEIKKAPHTNLSRPGLWKQYLIYLKRDIKSKLANVQYVSLTLLEAPVLGFILSFIIRYIADPDSDMYIFAENENIPIYIFMSLIVALFLGLTLSAEEIFRDRKILKREHFLNLSRSSYLTAKITVLIIISALQCTLFLVIANPILGIKGLFFHYWLALFATAFCANMTGLIISSSLNSAITIYIVIPLIIIPMMVLSGAMFSFDKLNRKISSVDKVPLIAELIPTRWTYEALMVSQFKDNLYSQVDYSQKNDTYYSLQKKISGADFNKVYRIPELKKAVNISVNEHRALSNTTPDNNNKSSAGHYSKLQLLHNELKKINEIYGLPPFGYSDHLDPGSFNYFVADSLYNYLDFTDKRFTEIANQASDIKDRFYVLNSEKLDRLRDNYYNYKLEEIVTKYYERNKILVYENSIVQNTDPVYLDPYKSVFPGFRTHFFAPNKIFCGTKTDTFTFNILLVFLSTVVLYIILYYELLAKFINLIEKSKLRSLLINRLKRNFILL